MTKPGETAAQPQPLAELVGHDVLAVVFEAEIALAESRRQLSSYHVSVLQGEGDVLAASLFRDSYAQNYRPVVGNTAVTAISEYPAGLPKHDWLLRRSLETRRSQSHRTWQPGRSSPPYG